MCRSSCQIWLCAGNGEFCTDRKKYLKTNEILLEHQALMTGRWITDLANTAALLKQYLVNINWVGFYLLEENLLVLGPFQGKPACTEIPLGKGVCGTAAQKRVSIAVADVHEFPGHIACDAASQSEIVIPLIYKGTVLGVLDVDAPIKDRFQAADQEFLETVVVQLLAAQQF
jgi:L-methionine (R)-S-oxide reductase